MSPGRHPFAQLRPPIRALSPRTAAEPRRVGRCFGVERVGLAPSSPGGLVRLVDLNDLDLLADEVAGQRGPIGAGALHTRPADRPRTRWPSAASAGSRTRSWESCGCPATRPTR